MEQWEIKGIVTKAAFDLFTGFLSTMETTGQLDSVPIAKMGEEGGDSVEMLAK